MQAGKYIKSNPAFFSKSCKLYFIYIFVFFNEFCYFISLPIMSQSNLASPVSASGAFTLALMLESFLLLGLTNLLSKVPKSLIFSFSSFLKATAFAFLLFSTQILSWYLFLALLAVSKGISKPFTRTVLVEEVSNQNTKRKKAFNLLSFFQNIAIVSAPIVGTVITMYSLYTMVFAVIIIANMILFAVPFILWDRQKDKVTPIENIKVSMHLFKSHNYLRIFFCNILVFVLMGLFITSTVLLAKFNPQLDGYAGIFFSTVGISICFWQLCMSRLRLSDKMIFIILMLTSFVSSLYFSGGLYIALLGLVFYSIFEAMILPEIYAATSSIIPIERVSLSFALLLVGANIGQAVGSMLTGIIIQQVGLSSASLFQCLTVLLCLVSVYLLWQVKKNNRKLI